MDKKNTVIGVLLIAGAFGALYFSPKPPPAPKPAVAQIAAPAASSATNHVASDATPSSPAAIAAASNTAFAIAAADSSAAQITKLANDFVEVCFTDFGGAVRDVALRTRDAKGNLVYPAQLGGKLPYVFNALHADPMLAFVDYPGLDRRTRFTRVSQTATEVVYRAVLDGNLEVTRRYTLAPNTGETTDPYQLHHETTFKNLTEKTAVVPRIALSIGTSTPTSARDLGDQITSGYSTGKDQAFTARAKLEQSNGLFGLGASDQKPSITSPGPLTWTTVSNQFFTTILTPDEPAAGLVTRRVKLFPALPDEDRNAYGLTAAAQFDVKPLAAHGETKIAANFYVGPKEYRRLANGAVFKADQDKVMQYGFFKFFSALLVTLMNWMHGLVPNWGVALILSTLLLKVVFLPLTRKATRSMKRMAKLQPLMTAIREKYKDNPAKQQTAMMDLYKEHKVNPMGGCLPMLIPLPFFMGFFSMLRSTAELRYASFLWASDLASTDTVGHVFGIPINILPLLFTGLTFFQMRLTPTPNADPAQAKMMQFMPLIFLFIYYSMPAALSLYSAANALFTIGQQLAINRLKDDGDPTNHPIATGPGGKVIKNVTPKKK